jgi:phosphoserine phosphatase
MSLRNSACALLAASLILITACNNPQQPAAPATQSSTTDPLPSWNDGPSKKSIVAFVERVTKKDTADFVAEPDRIAVFDNDGTLWVEEPLPTELLFSLDQVKAMAPQHPEWKKKQPFAGVLNNDMKAVQAAGLKGMLELVIATHSGMTTDAFADSARQWIQSAQSPRFHTLYTRCVYQPMLELLAYLRANGFKTYIVSGGDQAFMRTFAEGTYGIPPEQVLGTVFMTSYNNKTGTPVLDRIPQGVFVDDGPGKPVNIDRTIGIKPIAAFGNSDGDLQMLEWTASNPKPNLELYVHHTDGDREFLYTAKSLGKLDKGLTEANARHWVVVDMKTEWKDIFPPASH